MGSQVSKWMCEPITSVDELEKVKCASEMAILVLNSYHTTDSEPR